MGVVPKGTACFGIVMLLSPSVALWPVIAKVMVVVELEASVFIVAEDIVELAPFPRIVRLTLEPSAVVAGMTIELGTGVVKTWGVGVGW